MICDLTEQISVLRKKNWVNLQGLVDCSIVYRSTAGHSSSCQSISLLRTGTFNTVYLLVFDDGLQLAASVANCKEEQDFNSQAKLSEIETMRFVRESGLYPDIPIPKVYSWDKAFNNPVGAPYVLMDSVQGETVDDFDTLTLVQQLSVVKTLAKLKASLSKPVLFKKLGSIIADSAGEGFCVGPLLGLSQRCLGGPFESADELWRSRLEHDILHTIQEWSLLEKNEPPLDFPQFQSTHPPIFAELSQLLSRLIPNFKIPEANNTLVLHHPNIALRNIFFDKESLSSDQPKITGVLGWTGAQILPLMLTGTYPDDLMTSAHFPFTHDKLRRSSSQQDSKPQLESWRTVPYNWTFAGDSTQWPKSTTTEGSPFDYEPLVTAAVRRSYLRAYFSGCYAEQLHLLHGDASLAHATLFADASYYLKFHETMCGGWESWVQHATWIRETYRRLIIFGGQATEKDFLITGPNVYRASVEAAVSDLGIPEDWPCLR